MCYVWKRVQVHSGFGGKPKGKDHLEYTGEDNRYILKWIFKMWDVDMGRNCLDHGREIWRVLVNAVINLEFLLNAGNFLTI
jgi:hypothetical protein